MAFTALTITTYAVPFARVARGIVVWQQVTFV
jgi:hypothetical protein